MNHLFDSPVDYYLCLTKKRFKKCLKRLKIPKSARPNFILNDQSDASTHFFTNNVTGATVAIVCMKNNDDVTDTQKISLLIHEAVHIWQEIKEDIGEGHPSKEFEAYSLQAISQSLICEFENCK